MFVFVYLSHIRISCLYRARSMDRGIQRGPRKESIKGCSCIWGDWVRDSRARTQDVVALGRLGGSQRGWWSSKLHTIFQAITLWVQINNNLNIIIKIFAKVFNCESKNVVMWFFCVHSLIHSLHLFNSFLHSKQLRRLCDMLVNECYMKINNNWIKWSVVNWSFMCTKFFGIKEEVVCVVKCTFSISQTMC